jgi:hypothetical protein
LGHIHRVAQHGVVQPPHAAERPRDHGPGVHADPDLERRQARVFCLLVEGRLPALHGDRAPQRPPGVILRRPGSAEHGHHRVAGELV